MGKPWWFDGICSWTYNRIGVIKHGLENPTEWRFRVLGKSLISMVHGWWLNPYPSETYKFVSWDGEIPNIWKDIRFMFQTTNQIMFQPNMGIASTGCRF